MHYSASTWLKFYTSPCPSKQWETVINTKVNLFSFSLQVIGAVDGISGPQRGRPDVAQAFDYVRETMFSDSNGDRPRANNYVVLLSGNDRSVNTNRAIQAAQRLKVLLKDQGVCPVQSSWPFSIMCPVVCWGANLIMIQSPRILSYLNIYVDKFPWTEFIFCPVWHVTDVYMCEDILRCAHALGN